MQEKAPVFQKENPHSVKFDKFHNTRLFDRLQNKFEPKPYWAQYKVLQVVALVSSFFFHLFSAVTAATLVYFFLKALTESAVIAGMFTLIGLTLLEASKRITSERLFSTWFQFRKVSPALAGVAVLLAVLSITAAYFGAQRAVHEFTPPPSLVTSDSITGTLNERLATIDGQISDAKKNTWKGKLSERSQRTVDRLTAQREKVTDALLQREQRVQDGNDNAVQAHQADTTGTGAKFALFTLLAELLLILCLFYLEYFDYRSFAEYCEPGIGPEDDPTPTPPTPPFSANRKERPVSATIPADKEPGSGPHNDTGNPWSAVFDATIPATATKIVTPAHADENRLRTCERCRTPYTYNHAKQRYCTDACRISAWEQRNGKKLKRVGR